MWLDVRHPDDAVTATLVRRISSRGQEIAAREGCHATLTEESLSATMYFDSAPRDELEATLPDALELDMTPACSPVTYPLPCRPPSSNERTDR
jgi:beta-ureidopropionase / N-carbamoyl-L-amino-acid hydrolase